MSLFPRKTRGLRYTGELRKLDDGTYGGQLMDEFFAWPILLVAQVVEHGGRRFFVLEGEVGPAPRPLWIPEIDGMGKQHAG